MDSRTRRVGLRQLTTQSLRQQQHQHATPLSTLWKNIFTAIVIAATAATAVTASGPSKGGKNSRPDFATGTRRPNRPNIRPTIPDVDRGQNDKVFLEHADTLRFRKDTRHSPFETMAQDQYQVLVGNVKFRKGGMVMTCDSAYFYEGSNSFDAFSHVRMKQGDTLFMYCDELNYDGRRMLTQRQSRKKRVFPYSYYFYCYFVCKNNKWWWMLQMFRLHKACGAKFFPSLYICLQKKN